MKTFTLNDEDMQSLKTSLLTFVKRIAFQGTQSEEEAGAFFPIVNLLLGIPVALELNLDDLSEEQEEEAAPDNSEEADNSKACHAQEYQRMMECIRKCCSFQIRKHK